MKKTVICILSLLMATGALWAKYTDHRGHNIDSLQAIVNAGEKDSLYYNALYHLTLAYRQSDPHFALELSRTLVNDYPLHHHWAKLASAGANNISVFFRSSGQIDSALVWSLKSFEFIETMQKSGAYEEVSIDDEYSKCCGEIGNVYCEMGNYEKSVEYFLKALEVFEKHDWVESKTLLYGNLGYLYERAGNLREARRSLLSCMENARASGDSSMVAFAHSQMGEYYLKAGKFKKAQEEYLKADTYYSRHEDEEHDRRLEILDNLDIVRQAQLKMYRTVAVLAIATSLLLAASLFLLRQSRKQKKVISETAEVLEETIESLPMPTPDNEIKLNDREIAILKMLSEGKDSKYMADKLCLSLETVYWYRKRLRIKFCSESTTEIVSQAIRKGFI